MYFSLNFILERFWKQTPALIHNLWLTHSVAVEQWLCVARCCFTISSVQTGPSSDNDQGAVREKQQTKVALLPSRLMWFRIIKAGQTQERFLNAQLYLLPPSLHTSMWAHKTLRQLTCNHSYPPHIPENSIGCATSQFAMPEVHTFKIFFFFFYKKTLLFICWDLFCGHSRHVSFLVIVSVAEISSLCM